MLFFRITSKLLLLGYVVLMVWLAWDIWLLTPHAGHTFALVVLGGLAVVVSPVLWTLLARRAGTVATTNVIVGTGVWLLAGAMFVVAHQWTPATSVCHAVQAGHAQMIPQMKSWTLAHLPGW